MKSNFFEGGLFDGLIVQCTAHQALVPEDRPRTGQWHQGHFFFLARLETYGCTGGDIQPFTVGGGPVEIQGCIDLEERQKLASSRPLSFK